MPDTILPIYLAQAIAPDSAKLFGDYVGWAKVMLAARGVPATDLADMLETMKESFQQALPPEFSGLARDYLDIGLLQLPRFPDNLPSFITEGVPLETLARQYLEALLRGERVLPPSLSSTWLGGNARVRPLSGCVPAQSADVSAKQQFAAHGSID